HLNQCKSELTFLYLFHYLFHYRSPSFNKASLRSKEQAL
ncbi:MAG: hypothetical protein ACI9A2_004358, partial [Halioglobus sp.]